MRRFHVWAAVSYADCFVDMPDDATDRECDEACAEALDTLIGNGDTGWNEMDASRPSGEEETGDAKK